MTGGRTKKRGHPDQDQSEQRVVVDEGEIFPVTLMRIMSDLERAKCVNGKNNSTVLAWSEDGASMVVSDHEKLQREVLPLYFGQSLDEYDDFERRLFEWGFEVTNRSSGGGEQEKGDGIVSYSHKMFLRDHPYLCVQMTPGPSVYTGINLDLLASSASSRQSLPQPLAAPRATQPQPQPPPPLFFRRLGKTSVLAKLRHDATILYNSGRPPPPDAVSLENLFREASSPVALAVVQAARRALERTTVAVPPNLAMATISSARGGESSLEKSESANGDRRSMILTQHRPYTAAQQEFTKTASAVSTEETTTTTTANEQVEVNDHTNTIKTTTIKATTTTTMTDTPPEVSDHEASNGVATKTTPTTTTRPIPDDVPSSDRVDVAHPDAILSNDCVDATTTKGTAPTPPESNGNGERSCKVLPPKKRRSAHLPFAQVANVCDP